MPRTSEIDGVSPADLDQVVQDFRDAGAVSVKPARQSDGTYTVIATFADPPASSAPADGDTVPDNSLLDAGLSASTADLAGGIAPGATPPPSVHAAPPAAVAGSPSAGRILSAPGIPWTVLVDGADLVVRNIEATCFGGAYDDGDNGETESGLMNDGSDPTLMGVALPIRSIEPATSGSPLAFKGDHIPWETTVRVWREAAGEQSGVDCILIDNGPDVQKFPSHALDLNPNVVLTHFAPGVDPRKVANEWSSSGFSYRVVDGARWIS